MAADISGKAVVWGINNVTYTGGIVSGTNAADAQSLRLTRDSSKAEVADRTGATVTQIYYNFKKTLSATVVPVHASAITGAQASLDAWMPKAGTAITLADSAAAFIDGVNSGVFNVTSATANQTNDGHTTVDLEAEQYEDNDVTTTVS